MLIQRLTGEIVDSCSESRTDEALWVKDQPLEIALQTDVIKEVAEFERLLQESEMLRGDLASAITMLYSDPALCSAAQAAAQAALKLEESWEARRYDEILDPMLRAIPGKAKGMIVATL